MSVTNWTNITSPDQILSIANDTTSGYFWLTVNMMIWVVLMLAFIGYGFEVAVLGSTFIALIVSFFLTYMGLIAWQWCLFFVGTLIFMLLYINWSSNRN